jgi:hypothetical protein
LNVWLHLFKGGNGNNILYTIYIIWLKQEEMEEKNVEVNPENLNLI